MTTESLVTLMSSIGGSGLLSVALVFFFRTWISDRLRASIQHEYNEKLEAHKLAFKHDYDIQIERIRADTAITNAKASKVFEKQLDVIGNTYKLLVEIREAAIVASAFKSKEGQDNVRLWQDKHLEFLQYYLSNQLYLRVPAREKVQKFYDTLVQIVFKGGILMSAVDAKANIFSADFQQTAAEVNNLYQKHPTLLKNLEEEFQTIMGMIEPKSIETQ